ncbi:hypothetical protein [Sphingobium ummariense]|uniref:Uncharacterized protein n=1 Tax=Sphingobium ummariense RL-3 TaxID=1346791 RepID=T0ILW8_9SPHN|nr:hypothetical protein [Sphingobium ummariense]EQB29835.1 hypothetical protein M529_22675 [Sphingobium ummariense RL-3]
MHGVLEAYRNLPVVALLFTLAWAFVVVAAPRRPIGLGSLGRLLYFCALGSMGLAGAGGILLSSTQATIPRFPWVGFVAVVHAVAGMRARRALRVGRRPQAVIAVVLQTACAAVSGWPAGLITV